VAARAGLVDPFAFAAKLTSIDVQALQLRERPLSRPDPGLDHLVAPPRAAHPDQATDLDHFHASLDDAATRFDDAETTLAHTLAVPHPALGMEPYGARLRARLAERGAAVDDVVEVGPGTGELAAAWLAVGPARYRRIDRSPALLRAQAERAPGSTGVVGSATALPLPDASVALLVNNEVIADLEVAPDGAGGLRNVGALRFVTEIARVLRPGGVAWLSEFGGPDEEPTVTAQLDHAEVSIRFGDLVAAAEALGLEARLEPLADFLGLDLEARWLWRPHFGAVRALLARAGVRLPARAWRPETLPLPWPVEGLRWVSLREEGPGPLPARFWALLLRRPAR
jgi:SAM-dependent methyltransferase